MREQHDWLLPDDLCVRIGQIAAGRSRMSATAVLSGDIFSCDDGEFVPGDGAFEGDVADAAARHGAADSGSVEHAGEDEIVDVAGAAGDLLDSFFAGNGLTHQALGHILRV